MQGRAGGMRWPLRQIRAPQVSVHAVLVRPTPTALAPCFRQRWSACATLSSPSLSHLHPLPNLASFVLSHRLPSNEQTSCGSVRTVRVVWPCATNAIMLAPSMLLVRACLSPHCLIFLMFSSSLSRWVAVRALPSHSDSAGKPCRRRFSYCYRSSPPPSSSYWFVCLA